MSPIHDPRFSAATRRQDEGLADRAARMEYLKPLIMLLVGAGGVMTMVLLSTGSPRGAVEFGSIYPVALAIQLVFGVVGLFVACKLWLGGAGPLGLAVLRLAGIYALTDLIGIFLAPLFLLGLIINAAVYLGLLAWLFEFEFVEAFMLALITWLLKLGAGLALALVLLGG